MSEQSEIFIWPEERVASGDVREWIGSTFSSTYKSLTGKNIEGQVNGPTIVYRVNDWGVTARFEIKNDSRYCYEIGKHPSQLPEISSVVCKVGFSSLFHSSPDVYRALALCHPNQVPRLLTSRLQMPAKHNNSPSQTWLMFEPFSGKAVRSFVTAEPIIEMAKVMGRIQTAFAKLSENDKRGIPQSLVSDLPAYFDAALYDVREKYVPFWREHRQRLMHKYGLADERLSDRHVLEECRIKVVAWTEELLQYRARNIWQESIDHLDLHTNNAVVLDLPDNEGSSDLNVLIYDWEEASISCPYFSMSNLLENAQRLAPTTTISDPRAEVRRSYLQSLSWSENTMDQERAFDLAIKLTPVQRLHSIRQFFRSLGVSTVQVAGNQIEEAVVVAGYLADILANC